MVFIGDTDTKTRTPPNLCTPTLKRKFQEKKQKRYSRHIWTKRRAEIKILFKIEYKADALTLIKNIYEEYKIITLCMLNIDVDCNPPPKQTAIKTQNYKIKLTNLIS